LVSTKNAKRSVPALFDEDVDRADRSLRGTHCGSHRRDVRDVGLHGFAAEVGGDLVGAVDVCDHDLGAF
jgi:hypothetical protein